MIGYVEAPRAWSLTRGMARVAGVNLTGAVIEGWLSRAELAEMVDRCQSCTASDACTGWLSHCARSATLPAFCRNKAEIEALAS